MTIFHAHAHARAGEVFRVLRLAVIGAHGGAGSTPTGQIRRTVAELRRVAGWGVRSPLVDG